MPGVLGARITGGGWGGSVVALARPGAVAGRGWPVLAVAGASVEVGGSVLHRGPSASEDAR